MGVYIWKERLPSAYQEVEYIQSSGTQYIHTTQTVTDATGIYMKMSSQNIVSDMVYCGASVDSTDNNTKIGLGNVRSAAYGGWDTWTPDPAGRIAITADTLMELEINYKNSRYFKKDGTNVYALSTLSQSINYGINIFCHDGGNTAQFFSNIKVYEVKISSGSNDVAHLIPCYRKSDDVIGMYDLVNDTFYTNSGTGTFTKGPVQTENPLQNAYIGEYQEGGLPSAYQEVEYIQSSGTQYIDTNLSLGSNDFNIDLDFSLDEFNIQEQAICSIWTSTYNYWNLFIRDIDLKKIDCYTGMHHETSKISTGTKYNLGLTRSSSTRTISLDGTDTTWSYSPGSTNNTTLKLFTRGDVPGTSYSNTHIKMYYCKVYIVGTLVRDFVPCYRKSDTEIGMYDLINNVFYTNQGTGTFTKGPDVN